jgi:hypothetical protein
MEISSVIHSNALDTRKVAGEIKKFSMKIAGGAGMSGRNKRGWERGRRWMVATLCTVFTG